MNINMNEISYEIYKAFASTKPTEFDSFHRNWIQEHAAIIEQVTEIPPAPTPKRTRKKKTEPEAISIIEIEPEEIIENV